MQSIREIVAEMNAPIRKVFRVFKCINCGTSVCNLQGGRPVECKLCHAPSLMLEEIR
jgi:DNA-directed RNA polymerase subunit RPC12/RpoP